MASISSFKTRKPSAVYNECIHFKNRSQCAVQFINRRGVLINLHPRVCHGKETASSTFDARARRQQNAPASDARYNCTYEVASMFVLHYTTSSGIVLLVLA